MPHSLKERGHPFPQGQQLQARQASHAAIALPAATSRSQVGEPAALATKLDEQATLSLPFRPWERRECKGAAAK